MEGLGVPGVTRTAEPGLWDQLSGAALAREGSFALMEEMCVLCVKDSICRDLRAGGVSPNPWSLR